MEKYTTRDKLKEEAIQKSQRKTKIIIGIFVGFIVVVFIFGIKNLELYERTDVDEYDDISTEDRSIDDEDIDDDLFGSFFWLFPLIIIGFLWMINRLTTSRSSFRRI